MYSYGTKYVRYSSGSGTYLVPSIYEQHTRTMYE